MTSLPTTIALVVLALFAALGAFGGLLYSLLHGRRARLKRRITQVVGGRVTKAVSPRAIIALKRSRSLSRLKHGDEGKARRWAHALREQLMQAGIRIEVGHFLAICVLLAIIAWVAIGLARLPSIAQPLGAAIIGFGLPKLLVSRRAKSRIATFTGLFADALDVVVRGIRSGLPLGECINIIGREMGEPLGSEFRLISEGQKLGLSLQEALDRAVERTPTPDFKYFSIVLAIQQQTGGNLAETLAKLSEVLRARKRLRDRIKAFSAEAIASAAIIGSLPILVTGLLSVIGPDYIGILFKTDIGNFLVATGLILMGIGALVMRRMINFDI